VREDWHTRSPEDVLAQLGSSVSGLSGTDAAQRLATNGPNELQLSAVDCDPRQPVEGCLDEAGESCFGSGEAELEISMERSESGRLVAFPPIDGRVDASVIG
jgi:hypothetical protein